MNKLFDERRHYQIGFLMGALLYAPTGWLYADFFFNFKSDGFLKRLPIGILCFVCYYLCRYELVSKFQARILILIVGIWVTQDYASYAEKENFHQVYLAGNMQVPLIVSLVYYHRLDAIIYFLLNIVIGMYYFKDHDLYSKFYPLFVGTYYVIYFFFLSNRKNVNEELAVSNEMLLKRTEEISLKNSSLAKLNSLAIQVAHDIRAPVQALDFVSKTLEASDPKKQSLIKDASTRINEIADQLLKEFKSTVDVSTDNSTESSLINEAPRNRKSVYSEKKYQYNISKAIESVVAEKKAIVREDVDINVVAVQVNHEIQTPVDPISFKRILSNILNNSIEAFESGRGKVSITATDSARVVHINIQDNGKGIPIDVLSKLAAHGFSFGKEHGTGIGLSHTKETLESVGGSLDILSKQGHGTLIILTIPKV